MSEIKDVLKKEIKKLEGNCSIPLLNSEIDMLYRLNRAKHGKLKLPMPWETNVDWYWDNILEQIEIEVLEKHNKNI